MKAKKGLLIVAMLTLLLSSCKSWYASVTDNIESVQLNMTMDEVRQVMGKGEATPNGITKIKAPKKFPFSILRGFSVPATSFPVRSSSSEFPSYRITSAIRPHTSHINMPFVPVAQSTSAKASPDSFPLVPIQGLLMGSPCFTK